MKRRQKKTVRSRGHSLFPGLLKKLLPCLGLMLIGWVWGSAYHLSATSRADEIQPDMEKLYSQHEWFRLRDAVQKTKASALYRGAVAGAFNDRSLAEKALDEVISAAPASVEAINSRGLLTEINFRSGRYSHALELVNQNLALTPDSPKWISSKPLLAALGGSPEQSVVKRARSRVRYRRQHGNIVAPISVNGKPANFILDNGANISTINESEAKRLGLTIHEYAGKAGGYSDQVRVRTGLAKTLTISNFRLRNVAFLILDDDQEPFVSLPPGQRGLIGLPVLLALRTLRWSSDGVFEFGFPAAPRNPLRSNVCFDGLTPIIVGQFEKTDLIFGLDLGAQESDLFPNFASDFPNAMANGKKESTEVTGFGHSKSVDATILPEVKLRIGGFDALLRPAQVLSQQPIFDHRYYGNIGMDIYSQARTMTLDFQAMMFVMK